MGKSTLFNRITKTRDAIVADHAGLTRDRHYGNAKLGRQAFIVIDTGGFEPDAESGIFKEMAKQTRQAVAESDAVIFVVDARDGLSAQDHDIANYLRRLSKPCVLVANKARKLMIEGHTDERGGREYNLALGQKRAEAVAKSLVLLGATDAQVEAVSFGKEKPKAEGDNEAAWAENRRADIVYITN